MNPHRAELLEQIVEAVLAQPAWRPLDALLLPGGYFRLPRPVGHLPHSERVEAVLATPPGQACVAAARRLHAAAPGALLVVGLDAHPDHQDQDHLCAAFDAHGIAGLGRKVFPTREDTSPENRHPLVCDAADYAGPQRLVTLPSGSRALLGACYDLFGLAAACQGRSGYIRHLVLAEGLRCTGEPGFEQLRAGLLRRWRELLVEERVTVVLGAIHGFERPGRELYWQRHGLASASAALGGGLALGAAFFHDALPDPERLHSSPLAATGVPQAHIGAGLHRRAHVLPALDAAAVGRHRRGGPRALLRLFAPEI